MHYFVSSVIRMSFVFGIRLLSVMLLHVAVCLRGTEMKTLLPALCHMPSADINKVGCI